MLSVAAVADCTNLEQHSAAVWDSYGIFSKGFLVAMTEAGNVKNAFPVFVTGTGKSKKLFRRLGREKEIQKIFPAVWELEIHQKHNTKVSMFKNYVVAPPLGFLISPGLFILEQNLFCVLK